MLVKTDNAEIQKSNQVKDFILKQQSSLFNMGICFILFFSFSSI